MLAFYTVEFFCTFHFVLQSDTCLCTVLEFLSYFLVCKLYTNWTVFLRIVSMVFIFHGRELESEENAFCTHYFSWTWMVSHWARTIFHRCLVLWLGTLPGLWTWWLVWLGGANASDGQNSEPRCPWSTELQLHTYYSNQECSNELSVPFACPVLKSIRDFPSGRGGTHSLILYMN